MSRSRTARSGRKQKRGRGVNKVLDDALGAFIDVLDQHTLADMAAGQPAEPAAPRRKPASADEARSDIRPALSPRLFTTTAVTVFLFRRILR